LAGNDAPRGRPPASSFGGKAPFVQVNRLLIVGVSGALALLLSLVVIVASLAASSGPPRAVATPTPAPTATLMPTPTLPPIPIPRYGATALYPATFEAYIVDPLAGRVLLAHNSGKEVAMASTTKIMTAVIAILFGKANQVFTVPSDILSLDPASSKMGVFVGEKYTLRELLYGLLLPSGDDAAVVIADGMYGTQPAFVAQMNALAQWLGLTHTHYANVHGLNAPGHYSSAADLARLAQFALGLPLFRQIVATPAITLPATATHHAIPLVNTNILLQDAANLGFDGVKTGYTGGPTGAQYCLVADARLRGHEIIAVVLGDGTYQSRFIDVAALVAWAFQEEGLQVKAPYISPTPAPGEG
jgi:D-alanyl-D-alanine carboxypeptidase (penicillin-binding protein 5/6)